MSTYGSLKSLVETARPGGRLAALRTKAATYFVAAALSGAVAFGTLAAPAMADTPAQAGVSGAVRGDVTLTSVVEDRTARPKSGEKVFLGDTVTTLDESGLQLLLLDESVFTVGENAELIIDEYVYDPVSGTGETSAEMVKGAFRFVSGKIAEKDPDKVKLKVPGGTIGIRGTIVSVLVVPEGVYIFLDGPGLDNDGRERKGEVIVRAGGREIRLVSTGFAVFINQEGSVSDPFRASSELRTRLAEGLRTGAGTTTGDGGAGGTATGGGTTATVEPIDDSGADNTDGEGGSTVVVEVTEDQDEEEEDNPDQPFLPDPDDDFDVPGFPHPIFEVNNPSSVTSVVELDGVAPALSQAFYTGMGSAELNFANGQFLNTPVPGDIFAQINVDFVARTIGGGNSVIVAGTDGDPSRGIEAGSFVQFLPVIFNFDDGIQGFAVFRTDPDGLSESPEEFAANNFPGNDPDSGQFIEGGQIVLRNNGATDGTAATMDLDVLFSDGANFGGRGQIFGMTRTDGLAPFPNAIIAQVLADPDFALSDFETLSTLQGIANDGPTGGQFNYFGTGLAQLFALNGQTFANPIAGLSEAQIDIDFGARSLGGGNSYIYVEWDGVPGEGFVNFVYQLFPMSFNEGEAGFALFRSDEAGFTSEIVRTQIALRDGETVAETADAQLIVDSDDVVFTAMLQDLERLPGLGQNQPTGESLSGIATIADLDSENAGPGQSAFNYSGVGTAALTASSELGVLETPILGDLAASIDIDFNARTIGGGESFIAANFDPDGELGFSGFNFDEAFEQLSFDDGQGGLAFFAREDPAKAARFVELLIRNSDPNNGAIADLADLLVEINDGNGNVGAGAIQDMMRQVGGTPPPNLAGN